MSTSMDDIWEDDKLDRRPHADRIQTFLRNRFDADPDAEVVMNLDNTWGAGKSFFLERLRKQLDKSGHGVVLIDAWRTDHAMDPTIPLMAAIETKVRSLLPRSELAQKTAGAFLRKSGIAAAEIGSGIGRQLIVRYFGDQAKDALSELLTTEDSEEQAADSSETIKAGSRALDKLMNETAAAALASFRSSERSIEDFKSNFRSAVRIIHDAGKSTPFVVLIDELDRCRPTYAVEFLERVKHVFQVPGVAFILATDTTQLRCTIEGAYGPSFDGRRYLQRFFDVSYQLPPPSLEEFVSLLIPRREVTDGVKLLPFQKWEELQAFVALALEREIKFSNGNSFDVRDIIKCCGDLLTLFDGFPRAATLNLAFLFAVIVGEHTGKATIAVCQHWDFPMPNDDHRNSSCREFLEQTSHLSRQNDEHISRTIAQYDNLRPTELKELAARIEFQSRRTGEIRTKDYLLVVRTLGGFNERD